jgi:hypothetical protein
MTPRHAQRHDATESAVDDPSTDSAVADCADSTSNPLDARLNERLAAVSRWQALLVGAVTVVLAEEVTEFLPLGDTASVLALFPVTLAVMYGLLTVVGRLNR